jgi:hypothetical protein
MDRLPSELDAVAAQTVDDAYRYLERSPKCIIACDVGVDAPGTARFLTSCVEHDQRRRTSIIVFGAGDDVSAFQDLVDSNRLYYVATRTIQADDAVPLACAAIQMQSTTIPHFAPVFFEQFEPHGVANSLIDLSRRIGIQESISVACALVSESLCDLLPASRAYCYPYDDGDDTLDITNANGAPRFESAITGLAGLAVRLRQCVRASPCMDSGYYDRQVDDPRGDGTEHIVAHPLLNSTGRVIAVLIGVRLARQGAFGQHELDLLTTFGSLAASPLEGLMWQARLDASDRLEVRRAIGEADAFREEALAHYIRPSVDGQPLEISPPWVLRAHWVLILAAVTVGLFTSIASIDDYATGPAMVRLGEGRRASVVALIPGQYRPQMETGDSLRFNVLGYPQSYRNLVVTAVGDQIIGMSRVAEVLGTDALNTQGSQTGVVIVEASLPTNAFRVGIEELQLYDGMMGSVEIELGSQRLIRALISAF